MPQLVINIASDTDFIDFCLFEHALNKSLYQSEHRHIISSIEVR